MKIYLDNSATTAVAPEVIEKINEINSKYYGNPSSVHTIGQEARHVVDEARREIADFFGATAEEIIFTSGGSESDNLAIRGVLGSVIPAQAGIQDSPHGSPGTTLKNTAGPEDDKGIKPHVITSATEHHAVLHTIEDLEKAGVIEATYIKPDKDGLISAESVEKEIKENTVLVSLIYVNNETGVVTPIREIGEMIEKVNKHRETPSVSPLKMGRITFHTDAVQAVEFMPVNVDELNVDLLTFTAHKIHGPKGIGGLYVRWGVKLAPQITGGSQEFRLRAGTENVAGIAGLATALREIKKLNNYSSSDEALESRSSENSSRLPEHRSNNIILSVESLRDKLIEGIQENIPDTILNGAGAKRAPHIANISFMNAEGEAIILNLDFLGIAVSSGSACTSRTLEPSHVLTSMGLPPEKCHGAIRFSLSRYTTEEEIDKVIEVLPDVIEKLRAMSPFGQTKN